jgi:Ca2+-transporting ATPase
VDLRILHRAVPGRARIHCGGLKGSAALGDLLERGLRAAPGVRRAAASPLTGNVVVEFDPALPPSHVLDRMAALLRREVVPPEEDDDGDQTAYQRAGGQIAVELGTSPDSGLSEADAAARLARVGRNALPALPGRSGLAILLGQFQNPPVLLLAGAAAISIATGGLLEAAAIAAVVALAKAFGMRALAEGVETVEQLALTATLGCTFAQGYHIARPMPAEELERWMSVWRRTPRLTAAAG